MEKDQFKGSVGVILLLSGIAIGVLRAIIEPNNETVDTIGIIVATLMISAALACIFTTKTDITENKKEETVIDEKYVKQFNEARDLKWIANGLFILCAIDVVIMQWSEIGSKWWWLLQCTFILNFILAFVMRMISSKMRSNLKKQMEEDEKAKALIDLLNNMSITMTNHEDDKGEEYPKSM